MGYGKRTPTARAAAALLTEEGAAEPEATAFDLVCYAGSSVASSALLNSTLAMSTEPMIMQTRRCFRTPSSSADRSEAKRKVIEIGIADADAGRLIPFEQVKAWILSWGTENELPRPTPSTKPRS